MVTGVPLVVYKTHLNTANGKTKILFIYTMCLN